MMFDDFVNDYDTTDDAFRSIYHNIQLIISDKLTSKSSLFGSDIVAWDTS